MDTSSKSDRRGAAQWAGKVARGVHCAASIVRLTRQFVLAAQIEEVPSLRSSSSRVSCCFDLHRHGCGREQASCGLYPCVWSYRFPFNFLRSPLQLWAWRGKYPIEKANACCGCFVKRAGVLGESQHPACGDVAAAQNTRDTEVCSSKNGTGIRSETYRRNSAVCPLVGRHCLLIDVCVDAPGCGRLLPCY